MKDMVFLVIIADMYLRAEGNRAGIGRKQAVNDL